MPFQYRRLAGPAIALAVGLPWAVISDGAAAQSVMFKGGAIDENALIDALTPPPPGVRVRSILVKPRAQGEPGANPRVGGASVMVTFPTNSADVSEESKSALDVIARALASDRLTQFSFAVEGHADPRGGSELNQRLSQARAESVVNYLVERHQLPRERLVAVGKGDMELARPDDPTAPENRRVTFKTRQP